MKNIFNFTLVIALLAIVLIENKAISSNGAIVVHSNQPNDTRMANTYIKDGLNHSPPLVWSKVPNSAKSLALICADPDAPCGTWIHWVAWNIAANVNSLEEACPKLPRLPNGICQGRNSFGLIGYDGPSPPPGKLHHYNFTIYALDRQLNLNPGSSYNDLAKAMKDHILAHGTYTGTFSR